MNCLCKDKFCQLLIIFICLFLVKCEPWVTQFEELERGNIYTASKIEKPPSEADTITIMTWNIRFGAGRVPWFGDSCGERVILTDEEVYASLRGIANKLYEVKPDIILLQEIDIQSKRSGYIDQVQWLLDNTYFNYGAFASVWKAQWIPSDGLGRMNMGNAVLSRWSIEESERIQLPLRGDQDALTKHFYIRRNILKTKIALPGIDDFYAVNSHTSAFSKDDTKKKHIDLFKAELDKITTTGGFFVAGGDLNTLPPGAAKVDYCLENLCSGEDPKDKEGCDFSKEVTWLQNLYDNYPTAVPLQEYLSNEDLYFTNTPHVDGFWQKKLDYLFTNNNWIAGSDSTHQDATSLSDHVPISVKWEVPR
jgi:endonuclease/exonuclease/phosphatase family metal-dependent hydrolase